MKVIKSYQVLTAAIKDPSELAAQDDRAVADFRGFASVAYLHIERVQNTLAMNVIEELLEDQLTLLRTRRQAFVGRIVKGIAK